MIGILFNTRTYNHIINGIETFENIEFYRMFSRGHQVPLLLYCMQGITPGEEYVEGLVLEPVLNTILVQRVPWPKDNFCRAVLSKSNAKKLESCSRQYNFRFYQLVSTEERHKLTHITYLRKNPTLQDHLPDTLPLTAGNLLKMLEKHGQVMIKPVKGWLGKNIVMIKQSGESFFVSSSERSFTGQSGISAGELIRFFYIRYSRPWEYMVQQKIEALTFYGRVSECRVSVQKSCNHRWTVTGQAVRLAQPGKEVTNIHQGADAVPFESLFPEGKPFLQEICTLSLAIARELEKHFNIIDLGLDLMLDQNRHVWFIEANFRAQRLTYKTANDLFTWYRTATTPLEYILERAKDQAAPSFVKEITSVVSRIFPFKK